MANIPRIRLAGFWVDNSVVDADEFEQVDQVRPWLANFDSGSTHAPSGFVTVGGSGFQLTGTGHSLAASARLNVESTGEIRLKAGSLLKADGTSGDIRLEVASGVATLTIQANALGVIAENGDLDNYGAITLKDNGGAGGSGGNLIVESTGLITVQSGGLVAVASGATLTLNGQQNVSGTGTTTWQNGSNLTSGSTAFAQWSGTWWFGGTTVFVSSTWPTLAPTRSWSRSAKRMVALTYAGGTSSGPASPDSWEEQSNLNAPAPCWRTLAVGASGGQSLVVFDDLPQGGVITTVAVTCRGTISIDANTLPTYHIVRWQDTSAAGFTSVSAIKTDDGHDVDNFFFGTGTTTITANANQTIDNQYRYGLLITHPYRTGSTQGMRVFNVQINGTVDVLKV